MVELIDKVNSVIISLSQMTLTFQLRSLTVTLTILLFGLLYSNASICSTLAFTPLRSSDHVIVSVYIDFLSNSKREALFHCIAYDYSGTDWDGLRCSMGGSLN